MVRCPQQQVVGHTCCAVPPPRSCHAYTTAVLTGRHRSTSFMYISLCVQESDLESPRSTAGGAVLYCLCVCDCRPNSSRENFCVTRRTGIPVLTAVCMYSLPTRDSASAADLWSCVSSPHPREQGCLSTGTRYCCTHPVCAYVYHIYILFFTF